MDDLGEEDVADADPLGEDEHADAPEELATAEEDRDSSDAGPCRVHVRAKNRNNL